ncbi:hypothetical protein EST38_g5091 [Candolleomyces aberdarensis]|uniref:Uncharacterized protein n=1 Tax=Candolleomyces aberdarensis TaxID=2316362 RepID=A0A4Q2DN93_9AGAR|nr:hypothetical protein EST38_g5091 [Candolleomyces aberdarensis]
MPSTRNIPSTSSSSRPSTLPDPYAQSRRAPADGSYRNALSEVECEEARRKLGSVKTFRDLEWYHRKYPDAFGCGDSYNYDNRYYTTVLRDNQEKANGLRAANEQVQRLLTIRQQINNELNTAQRQADWFADQEEASRRYIIRKIPDIRDAIRQQHRRLRQEDELYLRQEAKERGLCHPIRRPNDDPRPDIRVFTEEERITRLWVHCTKCQSKGHYYYDHLDHQCLCDIPVPNHPMYECPLVTLSNDTSEDEAEKKDKEADLLYNSAPIDPIPIQHPLSAVPLETGWGSWDPKVHQEIRRNSWGAWSKNDLPKSTWKGGDDSGKWKTPKNYFPTDQTPRPPTPPRPHRPETPIITTPAPVAQTGPSVSTAEKAKENYEKKRDERRAAKGRKPWGQIQEEQRLPDRGRKVLNAEKNKKAMEKKPREGKGVKWRSHREHRAPMKTEDGDGWDQLNHEDYDDDHDSVAEHNMNS